MANKESFKEMMSRRKRITEQARNEAVQAIETAVDCQEIVEGTVESIAKYMNAQIQNRRFRLNVEPIFYDKDGISKKLGYETINLNDEHTNFATFTFTIEDGHIIVLSDILGDFRLNDNGYQVVDEPTEARFRSVTELLEHFVVHAITSYKVETTLLSDLIRSAQQLENKDTNKAPMFEMIKFAIMKALSDVNAKQPDGYRKTRFDRINPVANGFDVLINDSISVKVKYRFSDQLVITVNGETTSVDKGASAFDFVKDQIERTVELYNSGDDSMNYQIHINDYIKALREADSDVDSAYVPKKVMLAIQELFKRNVLSPVLANNGITDINWSFSQQRVASIGNIFVVNFDENDSGLDTFEIIVNEVSGTARPLKITIGDVSSRVSRVSTLEEILSDGFQKHIQNGKLRKAKRQEEADKEKASLDALHARNNVVVIGSLRTKERVALTVPEQLDQLMRKSQTPIASILLFTTDEMVEMAKEFGTIVPNK